MQLLGTQQEVIWSSDNAPPLGRHSRPARQTNPSLVRHSRLSAGPAADRQAGVPAYIGARSARR